MEVCLELGDDCQRKRGMECGKLLFHWLQIIIITVGEFDITHMHLNRLKQNVRGTYYCISLLATIEIEASLGC